MSEERNTHTVYVTTPAVLPGVTSPHRHVEAMFTYLACEPAEVAMTLMVHDDAPDCGHREPVSATWLFARDLLDSAFSKPGEYVGEGDVLATIKEDGHLLELRLTDIHGDTHGVRVLAEVVQGFLERTLALVPAEAESAAMDHEIDDAITQILEGTR